MSPVAVAAARKPRADGVEARARLLRAALRLFAHKGFAKTSTREIAQAAGANIAAIQYYFGDKAGLYSATFSEPMGNPRDVIAAFTPPDLTTDRKFNRMRPSMARVLGLETRSAKAG